MYRFASGCLQRSLSRLQVQKRTLSAHSISDKICFLGGGQMSEAILGGLLTKNVQEMSKITVVDTNPNRLEHLKKKMGVEVCSDPNLGTEGAEVVVLAVKPQNVGNLAASLHVRPPKLIISIVAGLTVADIKRLFHVDHVVRTMPNTPAMVLEGITVWMPTEGMPDSLKAKAKQLLGSFGEEMEVLDENYIDMATAISGSGPGYVFLIMEAMTDAAVHMGFPRNMAERLVFATLKGSAIYAQQSKAHTASLRNSVTSPGGTTASALYALERGGFRTVIADGIWAAYRRTLELGGNNSNVGPGRSKVIRSADSSSP